MDFSTRLNGFRVDNSSRVVKTVLQGRADFIYFHSYTKVYSNYAKVLWYCILGTLLSFRLLNTP